MVLKQEYLNNYRKNLIRCIINNVTEEEKGKGKNSKLGSLDFIKNHSHRAIAWRMTRNFRTIVAQKKIRMLQ